MDASGRVYYFLSSFSFTHFYRPSPPVSPDTVKAANGEGMYLHTGRRWRGRESERGTPRHTDIKKSDGESHAGNKRDGNRRGGAPHCTEHKKLSVMLPV